jgi:hypothetical protein
MAEAAYRLKLLFCLLKPAYPRIEIQRLVLPQKADDSIRVSERQVGETRSN